MKRIVKFNKIGEFRSVVSSIKRMVTYMGRDENNDPIYDPMVKKPIITFKGTVKMHGTNSGVAFDNVDGLWVQSREQVITPEDDNYGFAAYVHDNKSVFDNLISRTIQRFDLKDELNNSTVVIYGEWMGGEIQKGMGISKLDKRFVIFAIKVKPFAEGKNSHFLDSSWLSDHDNNIYNIEDFQTYSIDIDFNMPQLSQNKLVEIMQSVEEECPVAKYFGIENGRGEGNVWYAEYKGDRHYFKVKGKKHSVSRVKTLASVDIEKLNSIKEFVEYSVTDNRFNQALDITFKNEPHDIKKMGDLIRWVIKDITTEEADTLEGNGLVPKDVNKYISNEVRNKFIDLLNKEAFNS